LDAKIAQGYTVYLKYHKNEELMKVYVEGTGQDGGDEDDIQVPQEILYIAPVVNRRMTIIEIL